MTDTKERAKDNAMKFAGYNDTLKAGFEAGYIVGATDQDSISRADQKKKDIEKACKYLDERLGDDLTINFVELFKQAMEE